jgi:hypothetical protein
MMIKTMRNTFLFFSLAIMIGRFPLSVLACEELVGPILENSALQKTFKEDIKENFQGLRYTNSDLFEKGKVPTWNDISTVEILHKDIAILRRDASGINQESLIQEVYLELLEDKQFSDLIQRLTNWNYFEDYQLPDLETVKHFKKEISILMENLPPEIRPIILSVETSGKHSEITLQANNLIERQKALLEIFFSTTGYKNYEEVVKNNNKNIDILRGLVEMIRNEEIEVAIDRPFNARWWMPRIGLHNQFVTGTSMGARTINGRIAVEATSSSHDVESYRHFDHDLKPKYGYLRAKQSSSLKQEDGIYGEDTYILDLDKIKRRLSWTPGDSLNRMIHINPNWMGGQASEPNHWDSLFLPWDSRELMIPLLYNRYINNNEINLDGIFQAKAPGHEKLEMLTPNSESEYLEVQVWGPIRIEDIKEFIFRENPPIGDFLDKLNEHKIKIFDGRNNQVKEWTPPGSREPASLSEAQCDEIIKSILVEETYYNTEVARRINRFFVLRLSQINQSLLEGETVPAWGDIENLKEIYRIFMKNLDSINDINEEEKLKFVHQVFANAINNNLTLKKFFAQQLEGKNVEGLSLSDQENHYYFRIVFEKLNAYIPTPWKIKLPPVNVEKARSDLVKQAEKYYKRQQRLLREIFPTTGYEDYKEIKKLNTQHKEELGEIVDLIRNEDVNIAISRPGNARWWVPKVGLHNQHVTGTSRGYKGQSGRNAVEASYSNRKFQKYANLDNDVKPKYGLLYPKTNSSIQPVSTHYGEDTYILDLKKIKKRLTWTPGDSLNRMSAHNFEWTEGTTLNAKSWDYLFLPWSSKELMIPLLHKQFNGLNPSLALNHQQSDGIPKAFNKFQMQFENPSARYLEVQIWGPIRLADVKEFIFKSGEPQGEFLEALIEKGIKIYDGSAWPHKEWFPPAEKVEGLSLVPLE